MLLVVAKLVGHGYGVEGGADHRMFGIVLNLLPEHEDAFLHLHQTINIFLGGL
jgi:hypothetical protein